MTQKHDLLEKSPEDGDAEMLLGRWVLDRIAEHLQRNQPEVVQQWANADDNEKTRLALDDNWLAHLDGDPGLRRLGTAVWDVALAISDLKYTLAAAERAESVPEAFFAVHIEAVSARALQDRLENLTKRFRRANLVPDRVSRVLAGLEKIAANRKNIMTDLRDQTAHGAFTDDDATGLVRRTETSGAFELRALWGKPLPFQLDIPEYESGNRPALIAAARASVANNVQTMIGLARLTCGTLLIGVKLAANTDRPAER